MTAATSALAAPPTNRQTTGRTKGARRQRAAGVDSADDGVDEDDEEDMTLRRVAMRTRKMCGGLGGATRNPV
ncbi:hypothetical protein GCM10009803_11540 [Microbacterium ginsengiterrae]